MYLRSGRSGAEFSFEIRSLSTAIALYRMPGNAVSRLFFERALFLRRDPQRLHLAIQIAAFQPEQLRSTRDIAARLLQLAQNVLTLRGFLHFMQAAESFPGLALRFAGAIQRGQM